MGSIYLNLVNELLRRTNDVEIPEADFLSVRGLQATAKDAVRNSVRFINNDKPYWPFNAVEETQLLSVGQEEYSWPMDFSNADWLSFQIQKDDVLNVKSKHLRPIPRSLWYSHLRDTDDDAGPEGRSIPSFVFDTHGDTWGVTPSPDREYTVKYRYYRVPVDLDLYDDETTIPTRFNYVILDGAVYYMNLFKGDTEATDRAESKFRQGINSMINNLLPNNDRMYVVYSNLGGGMERNHMWTGM